jgi:hypothetical protein
MYSPYGPAGEELQFDAMRLLDNLLAPKAEMAFGPGETPQWTKDDDSAFWCFYAFDASVAFLDDPPAEEGRADYVDGADVGNLFRNFRELNASLPFSEGERHWLLGLRTEHIRGRDYEAFFGRLVAAETTVISAGVQQELVGRDLARRWPAWRREEQEFTGQGSLQNAQRLLSRIAHHVVPNGLTGSDAQELPYAVQFLSLEV